MMPIADLSHETSHRTPPRKLARLVPTALCTLALAGCAKGEGEPETGEAAFKGSSGVSLNAFAAQEQNPGAPGAAGTMAPPTGGQAVAGGPPPQQAPSNQGAPNTETPASSAGTSAGPGSTPMGSAGTEAPDGEMMAGAGGAGGAGGTGDSGSTMTDPASMDEPAEPPEPAEPAGPTEGTLTVSFTSVSPGQRYGPRNCGAVWIETASGEFVKTLERWAGIRARDLTAWNAASGGWGSSGFFGGGGSSDSPDQMDAVTAATLRSHESHTSTWSTHDLDGNVVPDGTYRLMIEVTEDSRGPTGSVEFEKGPEPLDLSPPDQSPWTGLTITFEPQP